MVGTDTTTNNVLVIGSMQNVEAYQNKVLEMKSQVGLRSEMLDRILDQAAQLEADTFDRALVLVTPPELELHLTALLPLIQPALKNGSTLELSSSSSSSQSTLAASGWQNIQSSGTAITASKPAPAPAAVPLRLKRPSANGTRKSSIWATSPAPSTPTIDESSLLTSDDLKRRQTIQKPDCDVKRTRKACKDCTCGLREILLQEDSDLMAIQAARARALPIQTGENGKQIINTGAMTSSCGSCSLGDAFRCASCPYLGMPAFEPGQKIELGASSFGGDDLP